MSQRQFDKETRKIITHVFWGMVTLVLMVILLLAKVSCDTTIEEDVGLSVQDMWRFSSSPSDRRAILEGLSAMECIDAGLCDLSIPLPVDE